MLLYGLSSAIKSDLLRGNIIFVLKFTNKNTYLLIGYFDYLQLSKNII